MADIRALRSYLVSLGFSVNTTQAAQFNNAIKTAAQVVQTNTSNIVGNIAKWGVAAVGMFEGVGVAALAMADKVARADQEYRLFGQRMFMDTQHAKSLKIALDALGQPLEAIAFDPELHGRFDQLETLQRRLQAQLGGDFTRTMIQLRDAQFEFTKFRVEALYFRDLLVKDIFQALGGEKLTAKLRSWNEYIVEHIPKWANIIATYIVPVITDAWNIMKSLFQVGKDFAQLFTQIVGLMSGDPALQGAFSFEKFAAALQKSAHWLAVVIEFLTNFAGTITGAAIGGAIGGPVGALIGAAAGGATDLIRSTFHGQDQGDGAGSMGVNTAGGMGDFESIAHSVAMVESGDRQTDRSGRTIMSSAGAIGRMQLMPGTARGLGVDPYNAEQNLAGGRAYLSQLYGKYGNWHDALAAYNWGPGNVDKTLKMHRQLPASVEAYAGGVMGRANVQIGSININHPNASPEQIVKAVSDAIDSKQQATTASLMNEMRTAY